VILPQRSPRFSTKNARDFRNLPLVLVIVVKTNRYNPFLIKE